MQAALTSGKASDSPRTEIPIQITACSENARGGWGGSPNIVDGPQAAMIVEGEIIFFTVTFCANPADNLT